MNSLSALDHQENCSPAIIARSIGELLSFSGRNYSPIVSEIQSDPYDGERSRSFPIKALIARPAGEVCLDAEPFG